MKKFDIHFYQIEPVKILMDPAFIKMKPVFRGIHFSLMMHSLSNGGGIIYDEKLLCRICNCTRKILLQFFEKYGKLYYSRKNRLYCVYSQFIIRKQKKFLQTCSKSGLRGSQVTWGRHSKRNEKRNEI